MSDASDQLDTFSTGTAPTILTDGGDPEAGGSDGEADSDSETDDEPTEAEVVRVASEAAEGVVLDRYKQSALRDMDVTVRFEEGVLSVDVYVNPPDDADPPADTVADQAARAAQDAVDDLFGV